MPTCTVFTRAKIKPRSGIKVKFSRHSTHLLFRYISPRQITYDKLIFKIQRIECIQLSSIIEQKSSLEKYLLTGNIILYGGKVKYFYENIIIIIIIIIIIAFTSTISLMVYTIKKGRNER